MKTKSYKNTDLEKKWLLLDASNKTLGRLSAKISSILMGKNKAQYTPHNDLGDYIVVINAEKVKVTGNKDIQKKYYRHSGYPGGLKSSTFSEIIEKNPEDIIFKAVKGMLPKNKLSNSMISKLKVYKGENHPHIGQNPHKIEL
ncbi:MAG: 50S ribosomal protein L13 [Gammaproteobacteria bacterium]|tara:strand:- start:119 stop:547 length:429 start_codon:yes stop_codon:yes gene_type:complete